MPMQMKHLVLAAGMLAMAMMAYFIATMTKILGLEMSGMIALLVCGIIQAHYAWWNLSPQGK